MKTTEIPALHQQARKIKNRKRHQHDGGRAWIKDGQLHEAISKVDMGIKGPDLKK